MVTVVEVAATGAASSRSMASTAAARFGTTVTSGSLPPSPWWIRKGWAPTAFAMPTSEALSPTTHDAVRSRSSAAAAACAIPGPGLRSALEREKAATMPSGWYGQKNHAST
jgi:hypothetical protein